MIDLPLFPLKTVLLPGNNLSLKIFEPRYIDMVAKCMRKNSRFGVVLIQEGEETSSDLEIFSVGTTAGIVDWLNRSDGLLGITAQGHDRFEIKNTRIQSDGLVVADIEILSEENYAEFPLQYTYLKDLLTHIRSEQSDHMIEATDFVSTLYQLIYLLPLESTLKQRLLEVPDSIDRAMILHAELIRLGVIQYVKPDMVDI